MAYATQKNTKATKYRHKPKVKNNKIAGIAPPSITIKCAQPIFCILAAGLSLGAAVFASVAASGHPVWPWPEVWRFADSSGPILFSADGYYYMYRAQEILLNGIRPDSPPLSLLAAAAARLGPLSVEGAAFYLPIIFSLLLGLLVWGWGRLLGAGLASTLLAAVATGLIPAWVTRSGPGWFDTDPPIALFWQAGLLGLTWAVYGRKASGRRWALGGGILSLGLLCWFWRPGFVLAGGSLAAWALLTLPPSRLWSFGIRLATASALALWAALILLLPPESAPAPTALADFVSDHLRLAFTLKADGFYQSINELTPLSPLDWLCGLGGNPVGGLVALAAALTLMAACPAARLPVGLGLICALAGLRSVRFLYLAAFPLALGLGFLPHTLPWLAARLRINLKARTLRRLACLSVLVVFGCCLHWAATQELKPHWQRGHDQLVLTLRDSAPPAAKFWNWWDDGYFLLARSGRRPFFHGGSQTPTVAYIVAHPCLMEDRRLAARWIRFFALRGPEALAPLSRAWGEETAWTKLETMLSMEDKGQIPVEDLARLPGGADWLYPSGQVFWYMPHDFLDLSHWWGYLGLARRLEPDPDLIRSHIETIARSDFRYKPGDRTMALSQALRDKGYTHFGEVRNIDLQPLAPPWPDNSGPYIVFSDKIGYNYIVDELSIKSLPLALLAAGEKGLDNFKPLALDHTWGGVWEVLP